MVPERRFFPAGVKGNELHERAVNEVVDKEPEITRLWQHGDEGPHGVEVAFVLSLQHAAR